MQLMHEMNTQLLLWLFNFWIQFKRISDWYSCPDAIFI